MGEEVEGGKSVSVEVEVVMGGKEVVGRERKAVVVARLVVVAIGIIVSIDKVVSKDISKCY